MIVPSTPPALNDSGQDLAKQTQGQDLRQPMDQPQRRYSDSAADGSTATQKPRSRKPRCAHREPRSKRIFPRLPGETPQEYEARLRQSFAKTEMCKFFLAGRCRFSGRECRFAHDRTELQEPPNLHKTQMCKAIMETGWCENGESCTYAHSEGERREVPAPVNQDPSSNPDCFNLQLFAVDKVQAKHVVTVNPAALGSPSLPMFQGGFIPVPVISCGKGDFSPVSD